MSSMTWRFWAFLFSTVIVLAIVSAIVVVRNQRKENREWCREQGYGNYATNDGYCIGTGGLIPITRGMSK